MIHGTDLGGKQRKNYLSKQGLISCGFCPYHRSENATRRRPRPDRHKNINRESIRRPVSEPESTDTGECGAMSCYHCTPLQRTLCETG